MVKSCCTAHSKKKMLRFYGSSSRKSYGMIVFDSFSYHFEESFLWYLGINHSNGAINGKSTSKNADGSIDSTARNPYWWLRHVRHESGPTGSFFWRASAVVRFRLLLQDQHGGCGSTSVSSAWRIACSARSCVCMRFSQACGPACFSACSISSQKCVNGHNFWVDVTYIFLCASTWQTETWNLPVRYIIIYPDGRHVGHF